MVSWDLSLGPASHRHSLSGRYEQFFLGHTWLALVKLPYEKKHCRGEERGAVDALPARGKDLAK